MAEKDCFNYRKSVKLLKDNVKFEDKFHLEIDFIEQIDTMICKPKIALELIKIKRILIKKCRLEHFSDKYK